MTSSTTRTHMSFQSLRTIWYSMTLTNSWKGPTITRRQSLDYPSYVVSMTNIPKFSPTLSFFLRVSTCSRISKGNKNSLMNSINCKKSWQGSSIRLYLMKISCSTPTFITASTRWIYPWPDSSMKSKPSKSAHKQGGNLTKVSLEESKTWK